MNAFALQGFQSALVAPEHVTDALLLLFQGDRLLVGEGGELPHGLPADFGLLEAQFLGTLNGRAAFGAAYAQAPPADFTFKRLRGLFGALPDPVFALAAYAYQVVEWDRTNRFCGACATPTLPHPTERAKRCPNCGLTSYPRLAPAVIVLVRRGGEVLLARSPHFPQGLYSTIAGFVDLGETLEDAVHREVREEVGVEIAKVRYFGSQPWPFPHSLMVGFTAEYAGGDIKVDGVEIEDAGWFGVGELPQIPTKISISRALIDAAVLDLTGEPLRGA